VIDPRVNKAVYSSIIATANIATSLHEMADIHSISVPSIKFMLRSANEGNGFSVKPTLTVKKHVCLYVGAAIT
jgi:hypothetical protein